MIADSPEIQTTLAQALEEFWASYTGVRPESVQIVAGDQAVAVWLKGVLSPAEQQAARTQAGREMLGRVGERILEHAKPQLLHLVEDSVHQETSLIDVHLDVANSNLVAFFRIG